MSEPNHEGMGLTSPNQENGTMNPSPNEHIQRTEGAFPINATVPDDNGYSNSAAPQNGKLFNDPSIANMPKN